MADVVAAQVGLALLAITKTGLFSLTGAISLDTYKNKYVLISGGSSGIGLALAKNLAQLGANICILARCPDRNEIALTEIEKMRSNPRQVFESISADVSNFEQIASVLNSYLDRNGAPDILINSAGVVKPGIFEDLDLELFHWMMDINYFGAINIIKTLIEPMLKRGSGHIVNIASSAAFIGIYGYSAYSGSKYALRGFSDVLRSEMKPKGIQVSLVFPPDTDTPQLAYENQFKPRVTKEIAGNAGIMNPHEVAQKILSGIEHHRYVIIPGFENNMIYKLNNLLGNLIYPLMDWMVKRALNKSLNSD